MIDGPTPVPVRPSPAQGECFPGYLLRFADFFGTTAIGAAVDLGIIAADRPRMSPSALERLPADDMQRLATVLRLDPLQLSAMGTESLRNSVGEASDGHVSACDWRYKLHTPFCPMCMAEAPGVWHLDWQWPYAAVCPHHSVVLVGECPGCGRSPFLRWGRGATRWGVVPRLGHCMNAPVTPNGDSICGYELASAPALEVSRVDTAARQLLGSAMAGESICGRFATTQPDEFLADIRGIVLLAIIGGGHVDLARSSDVLAQAASVGVARRLARHEPSYIVKRDPPLPSEVAAFLTMAVDLLVDLDVAASVRP